jgi:hypothetical protein
MEQGGLTRNSGNVCKGYHARTHTPTKGDQAGTTIDITPLLDSCNKDDYSWYADREYPVACADGPKGKGTFRSRACKVQTRNGGDYTDGMCSECAAIPKQKTFQKRVENLMTKTTTNNARSLMQPSELLEHARELGSEVRKLRDAYAKAENRILELESQTPVYALRGIDDEIVKVALSLLEADEKGCLEKDPTFWVSAMKCQLGNCVFDKNTSRRHDKLVHMFYEVLLIWGGSRAVQWVANNLMGPAVSTIRADVQKLHVYDMHLSERSVIEVARVYKLIMEDKKIPLGSVLCTYAEDETKTVPSVQYSKQTGKLLGF